MIVQARYIGQSNLRYVHQEKLVMTEHGMRTLLRFAMVMAGPLVSATAVEAQTAFEATSKGARCTQNSQGTRLCRFEVGADLIVSITAVGEPDAGISFLRSNIEGDFFARTAIQHHCVIVSAGMKAPNAAKAPGGDLAFVSPRTGRVYRTWQECETAQG